MCLTLFDLVLTVDQTLAPRVSCGTSNYALVSNGILVRGDALLTTAVNVLTPPSEGIWIGGYSLVRSDWPLLLLAGHMIRSTHICTVDH